MAAATAALAGRRSAAGRGARVPRSGVEPLDCRLLHRRLRVPGHARRLRLAVCRLLARELAAVRREEMRAEAVAEGRRARGGGIDERHVAGCAEDLVRCGEGLGQQRRLRVEEAGRRERRLAGRAAPLRPQAEVAEAVGRHELGLEISHLIEEIGTQQVVPPRLGRALVEQVERVPWHRLRVSLVGEAAPRVAARHARREGKLLCELRRVEPLGALVC
eukprot:scaffold10848_cov57-Phaeocystis_antarctica.AAC.1